jgi:tRNA G18 (ribose-2'-O)-methylase SpoU
MPPPRISTRNARFQQWHSLLTNRTKRHRHREFLIQGVRPITVAVDRGFPLSAILFDADRGPTLSPWASGILARDLAEPIALSAELLHELGEKTDHPPELIAVARQPPDDLARIVVGPAFLGVLFDRPTSPGNIGTLVRSADAFGAAGVIVTGHAADPYDPKAVRASTGSLFAVPVVRAPSHRDVLSWAPPSLSLVGLDEAGSADIAEHDLTGPTLLLVGNETSGLSAGWREACKVLLRIPISGSASSLNAAASATVALYEAARQRR